MSSPKFLFLTFFALAAFSILGTSAFAQNDVPINAGFVKGIWYSKNPFFAGDEIRIYSAVQNQSGFDIIGTVRFFDNGVIVGESEFSAVNGRVVEAWTDWSVTGGEHEIYVEIANAKKYEIGKEPESIALAFGFSAADKWFVDTDTDGDEVGDMDDTDNDNDGLDDAEELAIGSNPLEEDTDGDGIIDGNDPEPIIAEGSSDTTDIPEEKGEVYDKMGEIAQSAGESVVSFIDDAAEKLKDRVDIKKDEIKEEIDGRDDKLLSYSKLASLSVISWVFGYKVALWTVLSILAFIFLKLFLMIMKRRR